MLDRAIERYGEMLSYETMELMREDVLSDWEAAVDVCEWVTWFTACPDAAWELEHEMCSTTDETSIGARIREHIPDREHGHEVNAAYREMVDALLGVRRFLTESNRSIVIVPVDFDNKEHLLAFDKLVMGRLDVGNPFLASFCDDGLHIEEALAGIDSRQYFVAVDKLSGNVVARCGIKFNPPADDICAYGDVASDVFSAHSEYMASLIGDLVSPECRGRSLQKLMIEHRLSLLAGLGYRYAVAGIAEGNVHSRDNYIAEMFDTIGYKDITWETAQGPVTKSVELLGRSIA